MHTRQSPSWRTHTHRTTLDSTLSHRMDIDSVYLWVLPMFHAAGWTYPWAATFAVSTQITLRNVSYPLIWNHLCHSRVTHYCGAPTVQVSPAPFLNPSSEIGLWRARLTPLTDRSRQLPRSKEIAETHHCHHRGFRSNGTPHRRARKDWNQPRPCLWSHVCTSIPLFNLPNNSSHPFTQRGKFRMHYIHLTPHTPPPDIRPIHSQPPARLMAGTSLGGACETHG